MAARSSWRIPIQLNVELNSGGRIYTGTVTNLSESGMFVRTHETGFSEDEQLDISIPLDNEMLHLPGKLIRMSKTNGGSKGIGIKLIDPPKHYLEYLENLLYIL